MPIYYINYNDNILNKLDEAFKRNSKQVIINRNGINK